MSWKYGIYPYVARGSLSNLVGATFTIATPINFTSLLSLFIEVAFVPEDAPIVIGARPAPLIKVIKVVQYPIQFLLPSLTVARVSIAEGVSRDIVWKRLKEVIGDIGDDEVGGDGGGDEDEDLSRALSAVMGDASDNEDVKADSDESADDREGPPDVPPRAVFATPYSRVRSEIRDQVVALISEKSVVSCCVISRCVAAASEHSTHPPIDGGISLICDDHQNVYFIRWIDAAARKGYSVRLDGENRIYMTVAFRHESIDVTGCRLIISNVPARMLRAPVPRLRTPMPPWCLTVRDHSQTKLFSGPCVGHAFACVVCETVREHEWEPRVTADNSIHTCVQCGLSWHTECAIDADEEVTFYEFVCQPCRYR